MSFTNLVAATDLHTHRSGPTLALLDYVMSAWAGRLVTAFTPQFYRDEKGRPCATDRERGTPGHYFDVLVIDGCLRGTKGEWCSVSVEVWRCRGGRRDGVISYYEGPTHGGQWHWRAHDYHSADPSHSPLAGVYD